MKCSPTLTENAPQPIASIHTPNVNGEGLAPPAHSSPEPASLTVRLPPRPTDVKGAPDFSLLTPVSGQDTIQPHRQYGLSLFEKEQVMSRTRIARRESGRAKTGKRPLVWIAACGVGVCLCVLALSRLWPTAPSTAATGPDAPAQAEVREAAALQAAGEATRGNLPHQATATCVPYYRYKVVKTYPHDVRSFTQGLIYHDGFLYEGTGLYSQSVLTKRRFPVEPSDPNKPPETSVPNDESGRVIKKTRLPDKYFGEGVTLFGDKVIQLTWRSRIGFAYDRETLRQVGTFSYDTQGWGLTHDGKRLILSDGTATIRFLDPNTYAETGQLRVRDAGRPIRQINELEYIDGKIYANIWPTDYIAIISPDSGRVTGWIDLTGLHTPPPNDDNNVVANGIAYLPETGHLLVTGKRWPRMYEIELVLQTAPAGAP